VVQLGGWGLTESEKKILAVDCRSAKPGIIDNRRTLIDLIEGGRKREFAFCSSVTRERSRIDEDASVMKNTNARDLTTSTLGKRRKDKCARVFGDRRRMLAVCAIGSNDESKKRKKDVFIVNVR